MASSPGKLVVTDNRLSPRALHITAPAPTPVLTRMRFIYFRASCYYSPGTIYPCGEFWEAPLKITGSKPVTVIHASSHFTSYGAASDNAYGQPPSQQLTTDNPKKAVMNAGSHEYFAENSPYMK
ncbi:hypothetical protein AX15_001405 [Amanita polypyramis BW_CC]|nr:hypothetical protein AX15_001405 [Amanita polypyramis BW_CC]